MLLGICSLLITELFHPRPHLGLLLVAEFIRTGRPLHGTINDFAVKPFSIFGRERTRATSIAPVPAVRTSVSFSIIPRPTRPTIARTALLTITPAASLTITLATWLSSLLTVLPVALLNALLVVLLTAARSAPS